MQYWRTGDSHEQNGGVVVLYLWMASNFNVVVEILTIILSATDTWRSPEYTTVEKLWI